MVDADQVARFVMAAVRKGDSADRNEDARLYEAMKQAFHELYATQTGRQAFKDLLRHQSPQVRLWVAGQLLSEGDGSVLAALEALATQGGLSSFEAQMTLAEYRRGRLRSPFGDPVGEGEQRTIHDGKSFWRSPASERSIRDLVNAASILLPEAYIQFLAIHNGGEGEVAVEPHWLSLWSAEEVLELNNEYNVAEYFPGYFAFGSDGGGEMLAFEVIEGRGGRVVMLPFVGDAGDATAVAESFTALLAGIRQ